MMVMVTPTKARPDTMMKDKRTVTSGQIELVAGKTPGFYLASFGPSVDLLSLKSLEICSSTDTSTGISKPLTIKSLATFLSKIPNLETLSLLDVSICGNAGDYSNLFSILRQRPGLTKVNISGCLPSDGSVTLEPFLKVLTEASTDLREVAICNTMVSVLGFQTVESLGQLSRLAPHLESLSLKMVPELLDSHLASFTDSAIKQNQTLKRLNLKSYDLGMETCTALAATLAVNRTLIHLSISLCNSLDHVLPIIQALRTPTTNLRELIFHVDYLSPRFGDRTSFLNRVQEMLVSNYSLRKLQGLAFEVSHPAIPLYLQLNCAGRDVLLRDDNVVTKKQWVDALISNRRNTNVVFYLVSSNPSLCNATSPP